MKEIIGSANGLVGTLQIDNDGICFLTIEDINYYVYHSDLTLRILDENVYFSNLECVKLLDCETCSDDAIFATNKIATLISCFYDPYITEVFLNLNNEDYDIKSPGIKVQILDEDAYLYKYNDKLVIDHSPATLGLTYV